MLRVLFAALLSGLTLATPAVAQWYFADTGDTARAFVRNPDGTGLGLRCTGAANDRQRIVMELIVVPTTTAPDDEELARYYIGTWTFTAEVFPVGGLENGLQRYESRLDYMHPVNQRMRSELSGGTRVRFDQTFDFAAMQFTLRGSRDAIARLEAACPRLWAGRTTTTTPQPPRSALAAPPPPVPGGRWSIRRDGPILRAIVDGAGPTWFGLECFEGRADQTRWTMQVPVDNPLIAGLDLDLQIDGLTYSFLTEAFADMQVQNGFMPFVIDFSPSRQAGIIGALRSGATRITVPAAASGSTRAASFSGVGARDSFDQVLAQCGYDPAAMPGGPSAVPRPGPGAPSTIPPDALEGLRAAVERTIGAECAPGPALTLPAGAFRVDGDRVIVDTRAAICTWRGGANPFCVAGGGCQSWTYRHEGGQFALVSNMLR